jgi:hypothetical protein
MAFNSRPRLAALTLVIVTVAACGVLRVPLPHTGADGEVANLARMEGTIRGNGALGCVWLADARGNHPVVWPSGYTATFDPTAVYDSHGAVVGKEGDVITAAGGYLAGGTLSVPDRCQVGNEVWVLDVVTPAQNVTP